MSESSVDLFHLFLFVVPGFISVWSYRHFAKLSKPGDFEYFALSVFFGLVLLVAIQAIMGTTEFLKMIGNPYAASLVLSVFGGAAGWAVNESVGIADDIRKSWRPVLKWMTKRNNK